MKISIQLPLVTAAVLACGQVLALDFGGYVRAGPAFTNVSGAPTGGYSLGGAGQKYRLGNEGDFYAEFLLSQKYEKEGQQVMVAWMPSINSDTPSPSGKRGGSTAQYETAQAYLETSGLDIAPQVKFWAGKRYLRSDVHIVDTFFIDYGGVMGAGAENLALGPGKLAVSAFASNPVTGASGPNVIGRRLTADYTGWSVNPGGTLRLVGSVVNGNFTNGSGGYALTAKHEQTDFLRAGLKNSVWLQMSGGFAGLNGGFGAIDSAPPNAASAVKTQASRLVDSIDWQSGAWGGQALVVYERQDPDGVSNKVTRTSLGGRVSYAMGQNVKLLAEVGLTSKKVEGGEKETLNKITIAPTLAMKGGFWSRPELRAYVTRANWNDAASADSTLTLASGRQSVTIVGVQVEAWW